MDPSAPEVGFVRYAEVLRQAQLEGLFARDQGAIPEPTKLVKHLTCSEAHPGLCATAHKWCIHQVKACTKSAMHFLSEQTPCRFFHCRVVGEGDYERHSWFQLAHTRGGGPAMNMFAAAALNEHFTVAKCSPEAGYNYMMGVEFFGQLWLLAGQEHPVQYVYLAAAPRTAEKRSSSDHIKVPRNWKEDVLAGEVQVFPPIVHVALPRRSFMHSSTLAVLAGLSTGCKPKRKKTGAGITLKAHDRNIICLCAGRPLDYWPSLLTVIERKCL